MSHGEGNGNPLQCSFLENPSDGGAWWAAICGVAQSRTRLKRLSSSSSNLLYGPTLTSVHDYWKQRSFDYTDFCQQSDVSVFNTLSRFVISFPYKEQVSFNFMAAVTIHSDFGAQENKICHCFCFFPICHEVMGLAAMILVFRMLSFKPAFSLFSCTVIKRLFSSSSFSAIRTLRKVLQK